MIKKHLQTKKNYGTEISIGKNNMGKKHLQVKKTMGKKHLRGKTMEKKHLEVKKTVRKKKSKRLKRLQHNIFLVEINRSQVMSLALPYLTYSQCFANKNMTK